jgi:hypothetical protein
VAFPEPKPVSSSAMIIFGPMKQQPDVIRKEPPGCSQTWPRFVVLLPITHTPPMAIRSGVKFL